MDQISQVVAAAAGLIGVAVGYVMGFKNGRLAGELAALKSTHRHRRPRSQRDSVPGSNLDENDSD